MNPTSKDVQDVYAAMFGEPMDKQSVELIEDSGLVEPEEKGEDQ